MSGETKHTDKPVAKKHDLSLSQQKRFCVQHWQINDLETRKKILWIVMDADIKDALIEKTMADGSPETDIKLDVCPADVVGLIYEIMRARLDTLNRPVGESA